MVALLSTSSRMRLAAVTEPDGRERRMFPRRDTFSRVEGMRLDRSMSEMRLPHLSLALRDLSVGGCAALSQIALERGERLSVFFPPQGTTRGWDARGRVVRCDPNFTGGYRVAVEFDTPAAA